MIRVLIVEDSPTTRLLLQSILESEPAIHVVGTAVNGAEGLRKAHALKPDLITMDIHMPVMDGYETTLRIMEECPTPIVIVSQSVDSSEPTIAFKAIQAGALSMVQSPPALSHPDFARSRAELLTAVKLMAEIKVIRRRGRRSEGQNVPPAESGAARRPSAPPALVVVGASTGGPAALNQLLKALPADFPLPMVVVQHMSSGFVASLVRWLQLECQLRLSLAQDGERIQAGRVYFAPDDRHLVFRARDVLALTDAPLVSYVRPSATVLFESAARIYKDEAVGVLLTGMGEDGARGLREIQRSGGLTIAQDEGSSVVYGMPKAALALGAVERLLPLENIAPALIEMSFTSKTLRN